MIFLGLQVGIDLVDWFVRILGGALESHLASTAEGYRWGPGGLTIVLRVVESLVLTAFNLIKSLLQSFHSLFDEAPIRDQLLEHLEGVLGGAIGHL